MRQRFPRGRDEKRRDMCRNLSGGIFPFDDNRGSALLDGVRDIVMPVRSGSRQTDEHNAFHDFAGVIYNILHFGFHGARQAPVSQTGTNVIYFHNLSFLV